MIKNQNYYLPNFITTKDYNQEEPDKIVRTIKNKKIVYCHGNFQSTHNNNITPLKDNNKILEKNLDKKENENKNIELEEKSKNLNNNNNKSRGQRGSKYRGVSKNGNQWQVLIMINKKKRYIGNYRNEEEAASSYDIVAIQNHGNKAKTNFYYTPEEIQRIKIMKHFWEDWV